MKIKIWGARGSIPSPLQPAVVEEKIYQAIYKMPEFDTRNAEAVRAYIQELPPLLRGTAGGNTSCVEIQAGGETFIIDAGTGLRELGLTLMKGPCGQGEGRVHIFFSHAHWDHVQGFPFFTPAYIPGNQILIYSIHNLENVLDLQQTQPSFPVPLEIMQASLEFIPLQEGQPLSISNVQINTIQNAHPGNAYSYRFVDDYSTFIYASDAEYKRLDDVSLQPHIEFFKEADALIFDAQYTLRESWQKADWGHSSAMIGIDLARAAGVKKLILFHHDPTYSDRQLQEIQSTALAYQAQDTRRPFCEVLIAYEGLTLDLTPVGAVDVHFRSEETAAILTPTSVFDERGVDKLTQQLADLKVQDSPTNSIIDLSQVQTLTTASLKALVSLSDAGPHNPMVLANPSEKALRVIKLGGYSDCFAIYPSVETALAALQARRALNLPGQVIAGRYKIEKRVGQGRLGTVLKATDTETKETVALKLLSPAYSQETLQRFSAYIPQLVKLNQRNLVKLSDWVQVENQAFVVEPFLEAQTLHDLLDSAEEETILPDLALDLALDITLALEYIHSRGVIHGDLKPKNIFVTETGAKLSGASLGRLEEGRNLLEAPVLHLEPAYLAPEQILGQALDARTDLYTLGVILYQLFTGQLPFTGPDQEVMRAHLHQAPLPPRRLNPDISPSLDHLILKLLVKNPNGRYASAEQARRVSSSLIIHTGDSRQPDQRPLVGRRSEMQALQAAWQEAQSGRGQLVFITGEPGIGKTHLAHQMATQTAPPVALSGQCQESKMGMAYYPFIQLLQTYFNTAPPELFDAQARQLISGFTRLTPEIHQILPDLPQPPILEPKQEQLRLMSSLTQFIKQATQERPWLLLLDNLQWADQSSLELLRYLGHHLPGMALLIIGTYRDAELERGHSLRTTLRHLSSYPTYLQLALDRLDIEGVARVLANIWGQAAPTALTEKIYQHTEGNPYYVQEVAKALMDDGLILIQEGSWHFPELDSIRLPKSVREAVWRRLRSLSPDTQNLLRQAAVLGQTFRFVDLVAMSERSEWEVLEHLDVALERQLLLEAPGESMLRFSHAEIQSVLYEDMGVLRRRMYHHQAGEALERRALPRSERIAEELAYHFSQASEFEKALVYSIQAARQAQAAHANETALMWYDRTLEMIEYLSPLETPPFQPLQLPVHKHLGEVLTLIGHHEAALQHYTAAQALLEADPEVSNRAHQLAALACHIAEVYDKQSDYETVFTWLEKGFTYLGQEELSNERAQMYLIGARALDHQGKLDEAMEWCHKSLAIAARLKSQAGWQTMGQVYARLSAICLLRGYFDVAVHFCHDSLQIYQQFDDLAGQVSPYNRLGTAYFEQGQWGEAEQAYRQSLALAEQVGDIDGQGRASSNLAKIHLGRGEWETAASLLQQNLATWRQIGMAKDEAKTLVRLAHLHLRRQNWPQAKTALQNSQTIFTEVGARDYLSELEQGWGKFYLDQGELSEALSHIQQAIELAVAQQNPLEEGRAHRLLGALHLARTEYPAARIALGHSMQIFIDHHSDYEIACCQLLLARLTLATGAGQSQIKAQLLEACQTFTRLLAEPDLTQARNLIAQLDSAGLE